MKNIDVVKSITKPIVLSNFEYMFFCGQEEEEEEAAKEYLRGRGLCLVPVSCTQHVQSDINGADYWAQAYNGTF